MALEASRAPFGLRYDLVPAKALEKWARRINFAGEKYGDPTNFRKGLPGDKDPINHAIGHLYTYLDESRRMIRGEIDGYSDDHLGAALCNIGIEVDLQDMGHCYEEDGRLRDDYTYMYGEPVQLGLFDNVRPDDEPPVADVLPEEERPSSVLNKLAALLKGA